MSWQAGGGKTNMLVYLVSLLRARNEPFLLLVYNVAAKLELIARGVKTDELANYHSFSFRHYQSIVRASLNEEQIMQVSCASQTRGPYQSRSVTLCASSFQERGRVSRIDPVVSEVKIRLLVVLHFSSQPQSHCLANLYKGFIHSLADQARTHGVGCKGYPPLSDTAFLKGLVEKYKLEKHLDGPMNSLLSHPEKQWLAETIGIEEDALINYGVAATSSVLQMCYDSATSLKVNGSTHLYNPSTKKMLQLPVIDSADMMWIPAVLGMKYPKVRFVLVDEAHDMDVPQAVAIKSMIQDGAFVVFVDDEAQAIYLWRGVELDTYFQITANAHHLLAPYNYRNGIRICRLAQDVLDEMPVLLNIEPQVPQFACSFHVQGTCHALRSISLCLSHLTVSTVCHCQSDVQGVIEYHATFFNFPLAPAEHSTMIIGRTFSAVNNLFMALLGKGYPVQMHGHPDTVVMLKTLLDDQLSSARNLAKVLGLPLRLPCSWPALSDPRCGLLPSSSGPGPPHRACCEL